MKPTLITTALYTEQDWLCVRDEIQALEKAAPPDPYMNWNFQKAVWVMHGEGRPAWLIRIYLGKELLSAGFFIQCFNKRHGLRFRELRSMDFAVMYMAPMIVRSGCEDTVCQAFLEKRKDIAKATNSDLISLYKMNPLRCRKIVSDLENKHIPYHHKQFNRSHELSLVDGVEAYFKTKKRKSLYNIRRSMRMLEEELKQPLAVQRIRGQQAQKEEFNQLWKEFEELRTRTWQYKEAQRLNNGYVERLTRFFQQAVSGWKDLGWLDLLLLRAGDRLVAGQVNVITDDIQWVILLSYDLELARFSPGRILFHQQLQDSYDNGDRRIILGGAAESGKLFWSNELVSTHEVTLPLWGFKSTVWSTYHRFLKKNTAFPTGEDP